jgi:NADP-dependent 3-hydroxy acid dehydrogenase YdfG
MNSLQNKTAIITGGGSGIGKAIAQVLINEGTNVVIASRRIELLNSVINELNSFGKGKAVAVECDLRNEEMITGLVKRVNGLFPSIDILVNNSGIGIQKKVVDLTAADWDYVMDINLKGTFLLTKAVLPKMIEQRSGYIINIASQAAKHGYPEAGVYCASKFGLLGFAEALQQEVREYGIRVNSLCPALVQVPPPANEEEIRQDVLQTEDLAQTVLFLLKQPDRIKFENIGLYHL